MKTNPNRVSLKEIPKKRLTFLLNEGIHFKSKSYYYYINLWDFSSLGNVINGMLCKFSSASE
jgi:hypothetical protein